MNIKVIQIGNSRGVRIPKEVLNQCQIEDKVYLSVQGDNIIIKPIKKVPREGWDLAAKKMHERGDDQLLIPDVLDDDMEIEW